MITLVGILMYSDKIILTEYTFNIFYKLTRDNIILNKQCCSDLK